LNQHQSQDPKREPSDQLSSMSVRLWRGLLMVSNVLGCVKVSSRTRVRLKLTNGFTGESNVQPDVKVKQVDFKFVSSRKSILRLNNLGSISVYLKCGLACIPVPFRR
jgi:hypothetical protein